MSPLAEIDNDWHEIAGDIRIEVSGSLREPDVAVVSQALHYIVNQAHRVNCFKVGGPEGRLLVGRVGRELHEVESYYVPPRGRVIVYENTGLEETMKTLW